MWTDGLRAWFERCGRHDLPWRGTTEPWAVLVSEVMLQQTSVARVLPRWQRFLERWPTPAGCAAAALDDVLREWRGLGYPRRARALWLVAREVSSRGWPTTAATLRSLPGVGVYTARALLAFSDVGGVDGADQPPRDVNLARVAARAALGVEPHQATPGALDAALTMGRPSAMTMREYSYALFDLGATVCRKQPRCAECPLRARCLFLARGAPDIATSPVRHERYAGSLRQLRGAVLAAALAGCAMDEASLRAAIGDLPALTGERLARAVRGLIDDGLLPDRSAPAAGVRAGG